MSILWLRNVCMGLSNWTNVCFLHVSEAHCVGLFMLNWPSTLVVVYKSWKQPELDYDVTLGKQAQKFTISNRISYSEYENIDFWACWPRVPSYSSSGCFELLYTTHRYQIEPDWFDLKGSSAHSFCQLSVNNPIIAGFLLPLGIISIAYTFIFIRTRRLQMGERGDRVNRMIILVVVSFFITWLPNQMITFYLVVTPDEQINNSALYKISPFSQVIFQKSGSQRNVLRITI